MNRYNKMQQAREDLVKGIISDEEFFDIMEECEHAISTLMDQEEVAKYFQDYDYSVLPVVDLENRLVGIITIDDVVDIIEEEATEDMEKMAAILPSEKPYDQTTIFETYKARMPWLLLLMISATFTGKIIESFEELAIIEENNIPKDVIEMEITESIFSDEDRAAIKLMYDLKKRNFTLSMDDFGSGYSSLNLLRELPIDTLKIDKGFLETTDESVRSRVIVEEIISMATKINIKTICEGVETEQQRDFLKQAGCDMAQGFFYARPMPLEEFEELLDNEK